jgi:hypothetical protein
VTPKCPALGVGTVDKTDKEICDAATPGPWHEFEGGVATQNGTIVGRFAVRSAIYVDAVYAAHFNPSKVSKMLNALDAKDAEIERLKVENEKHQAHIKVQYGAVAKNNEWRNGIFAEKDSEIERLKKELNRFKRFASCQKPEDLGKRIHDYNGMIEGQGNEIIKLRTELAEERRLKDEARRMFCEKSAEFINDLHGPDYHKKEQVAAAYKWDCFDEKEQSDE